MLILSRRKNQTIVIDEKTTIKITELRGSVVKVGINAPKNVNIRRGEVPFNEEAATDCDQGHGSPQGCKGQ